MNKFNLIGILVSVLLSGAVAGTSYVQANGQTVAKINDSGVYYYHLDHLDSTSAMSNQDGEVAEEQINLPFGELLSGSEKYGFTGKEHDETVLQYFGARYYLPPAGRFLSIDPARDGANWYIYATNNPLVNVDSSGLLSEKAYIKQLKKKYKKLEFSPFDIRQSRYINDCGLLASSACMSIMDEGQKLIAEQREFYKKNKPRYRFPNGMEVKIDMINFIGDTGEVLPARRNLLSPRKGWVRNIEAAVATAIWQLKIKEPDEDKPGVEYLHLIGPSMYLPLFLGGDINFAEVWPTVTDIGNGENKEFWELAKKVPDVGLVVTSGDTSRIKGGKKIDPGHAHAVLGFHSGKVILFNPFKKGLFDDQIITIDNNDLKKYFATYYYFDFQKKQEDE